MTMKLSITFRSNDKLKITFIATKNYLYSYSIKLKFNIKCTYSLIILMFGSVDILCTVV